MKKKDQMVALLAEGVDRNLQSPPECGTLEVALLAEGVDRNYTTARSTKPEPVALLAEGVDRNTARFRSSPTTTRRPPRGGRG